MSSFESMRKRLELRIIAKKCVESVNTGKVENLHAHVNRNLQHANPNLHVL